MLLGASQSRSHVVVSRCPAANRLWGDVAPPWPDQTNAGALKMVTPAAGANLREVFGSILSAGARGFGAISFLAVLRAFLGGQLLRVGFVGIVVAACQFAVSLPVAALDHLVQPSPVVSIAQHPGTDLVTYRRCDLHQRRPSRTMMAPSSSPDALKCAQQCIGAQLECRCIYSPRESLHRCTSPGLQRKHLSTRPALANAASFLAMP